MNPIVIRPAQLLCSALGVFAALLFVGCGASQPLESVTELNRDQNQKLGQNGSSLHDVSLATLLDCAREEGVTLLQAHRAGPRPGIAENSIGAIDAALKDGAVFVEIDIARTADGTLILMHDDTLDRTTTGTGSLAEISSAVSNSLRLVDNSGQETDEPIPSLADALRALDGRGIAQLDRKRSVTIDELVSAVENRGALERVMFITYSLEEAIELHRRSPDAMISTGLESMADLARLDAEGVPRSQIAVWLGLGNGQPSLDASLADAGIETSYGNFAAESDGSADYRLMAANGAEILSVDNVPAASRSLEARVQRDKLLAACAAGES